MISKALRVGIAALALTATLGAASEASAFPILHGPIHFPGGPFHGPGFHGSWFHGWGGPRFRFGVYPSVPVVYGGCYVRKFINDDGDLVIRRICE